MDLTIRRISADGTVEDRFDGGEIIVGRATDCTICLPGLLVALKHARLTSLPGSRIKLESLCPIGVEVNGLPGVQSAELQPGDVMRIGGHRLSVATDGIEVELAEEGDPLARGAFRSTLADAGMRMRRPATWLAIGTLLVGLALPLALRYARPPPIVAKFLPTDQVWLTDGISNAHQHFGADCGKCHETLFVPVRDDACLSCHKGIAHHSDDPAILKVDGVSNRRCASCHREHQGPHGVVPRHPGLCADCHAKPERFADFPKLPIAADFATSHPELKAAEHHSGLIFPHDAHLKPNGVRGADGLEKLSCASCHVRDRGEASFKPAVFATQCQRCHQLDVDVAGTTVRLPHGDNELARTALLTYAKTAPQGAPSEEESARRRPGDAAPRGGAVGPQELADDVIGNRLCAKCHETVRDAGKPIHTRELALEQPWLPHAQFTHAAHAWQDCDDCHAKQASASADIAALPSIASCRACHGRVDSRDRLQSTCVDCHRFHQAGKLAMGAVGDERSGGENKK